MSIIINPFIVSGKIPEAYFCDRVAESSELEKQQHSESLSSRMEQQFLILMLQEVRNGESCLSLF